MKRRDLLRHLAQHGCDFLREGGNHTLYINRMAKRVSTIPRHNEINRDLARTAAVLANDGAAARAALDDWVSVILDALEAAGGTNAREGGAAILDASVTVAFNRIAGTRQRFAPLPLDHPRERLHEKVVCTVGVTAVTSGAIRRPEDGTEALMRATRAGGL